MSEVLVAVDAPHFYAGIVLVESMVVDAAPVLKWTIGKHRNYLGHYFKQKGWKATIISTQQGRTTR